MKSTFISYSTQNKEIADKLVEALEKRRLKCYIAPRDIRPGKIYACEIVEAIKNQEAVCENTDALLVFYGCFFYAQ